MGVELTIDDWEHVGHDIPLLVDLPAGRASFSARHSTAPAACRR